MPWLPETRSLIGKVRYCLDKDDELKNSPTSLAIAIWITFYYDYFQYDPVRGAQTITIFDAMNIPGFSDIENALQRHVQQAKEKAVPATASYHRLPYKDD